MSADLSPEDLERLNARLDRLPDFDPVGLWVDFFGSPEGCLVVAQNDTQVRVVDVADAEGGTAWWTREEEWGPTVTALHASTRDRLARWVASRLYPDERHIMVCVCPGRGDAAYHGLTPIYGLLTVSAIEGTQWRALLGHTGASMVDIDPHDPRLLPDGSRWADAAALVAIAVHLGTST